ncbi:hypothetical protein [Neolewinella agarilytica]|uniref:Uncharacterized protein n=1 Tax=Neolewinella agarilytica TaxID=478744 RepID=A0A1H9F2D0_9BACT|nr:hypothetical protein [Neolewinella agarilytica]SEQ32102.1 hypothetical protein SAMN05444359_10857 [Neolewinella agarilytica]
MENDELRSIWKSYDQKMDSMLSLNKEVAMMLTKQKLNQQISRLYLPKWTTVAIGLPYTIILIAITIIAWLAEAYFVAFGFGIIAWIMAVLLGIHFYQLYLIGQVKNNEEVLSTQEQLSKLRISSFQGLNLAVFQLPFWSVCWVSAEALRESPFLYGGVNLLVFALLSYLAYWLYRRLNYTNEDSRVRDFFLSGRDWEPIIKSAEILEQIREYER